VIIAEPLSTAVTVPEDETVATDAAFVALDTLAPLIVAPLWSFTDTVSVSVSPMVPRLRLEGDIVIDVTTGVGVVGAALSPPHAARSRTAESREGCILARCSPLLTIRQ
jgi:hypothetical protein